MLSACAILGPQSGEPAADPTALGLTPDEPDLAVAGQASGAPHVYMDIQYDGSGPASVIFALDRSRDGTPSDDPAIRLTPENGECNPQILRHYEFPPTMVHRPVYSQNIALLEGITVQELPNLMAIEATSEMMRRGLITEPDESRPQNVCSRKLWVLLLATEDFGRTLPPGMP